MTCGRIVLPSTIFFLICLLLWLHVDDIRETGWKFLATKYAFTGSQDSVWVEHDKWAILGPFQAGTRESEWGADPLEAYGGFRELEYDRNASFPSALRAGGLARWRSIQPASVEDSNIVLTIQYNDVDWAMMQSTYGWAGLQFQAWVRGTFNISSNSTVPVAISITNAMEFWLDGTRHHFGGDVYEYRRAPALILQLKPGPHRIDVKAINEIRMFGGRSPPKVNIQIKVEVLEDPVMLDFENAIVPEKIGKHIAGKWFSVPMHNRGNEDIVIMSSLATTTKSHLEQTPEPIKDEIHLISGQIRPLKIKIQHHSENKADDTLFIKVSYRLRDSEELISINGSVELKSYDSALSPHVYTYLHPSGVVSRGILRPPRTGLCNGTVPILLHLHGAGVDVRTPVGRETYIELPDLCAWVVIPSGGTTWAGDDWHRWGLADAEAAIDAIEGWMNLVGWSGAGVDTKRWFVSGHSNGGQGTWYTISHRHDRIFCANPVSGYLSIMAYVPYQLWHESEPKLQSVIQASMNSYRTELLVGSIAGTRIFQGHGSADDNVPVYNSRRIYEKLRGFENRNSITNLVKYEEFEGKGHWFPGTMAFGQLKEFVESCFEEPIMIPKLPNKFEIVVANPADTSSKGGILVDQLDLSDRLGRISVEIKDTLWHIETSNIRRWHFATPRLDDMRVPAAIQIDGQTIPTMASYANTSFYKPDGSWHITESSHWKALERHGKQLGAMDAILDTTSEAFTIVYTSSSSVQIQLALDISRNLFQYFGADSQIVDLNDEDSINRSQGNFIFLGYPPPALLSHRLSSPIKPFRDGVLVKIGKREKVYPNQEGLGTIFLVPLTKERLGIVIYGSDDEGYRLASRLFPLRTGVGQPDFIIVNKDTALKGAAGALALGFMDINWEIPEEGSYFS